MLVKLLALLLEIPLGIVLLLLATIVFDVIHVVLHKLARSEQPLLARIGALHTVHHEFLDRDLHIHEDKQLANVFCHVAPEFIVQLVVTAALAPLFPPASVVTALLIECGAFIFIMWGKPGIDVNHKHVDQLKAYEPLYFCVPEYHLLHHVYPDAFFSSWIKTLDHLLGTGISLRHRRVLMTHAASSIGDALQRGLQRSGAKVSYVNGRDGIADEAALLKAEILILNHDDTASDYQQWIEKFYALHQQDRKPVEVWGLVKPAIENPQFRQYARKLFSAQQVIYRHLLIDGSQSAEQIAQGLLRNVRRGFNVVPASWRGQQLVDGCKFLLRR